MMHKDLEEKWREYSLVEQMANIGSEISRTINWMNRSKHDANMAFIRACELYELTLNDSKNKTSLKEIARSQELFTDWYFGGNTYNSNAADWQRYFLQFAVAARIGK